MGPEVVVSAGDKVANPANKMVIVNKCFQNPTYKNIYGVGVVTAIPPFAKGMWAHYIKSAFERYFMWKVRSGNIAPFFEEEGLKLFFGTKGVILCADCSGTPGSAC